METTNITDFSKDDRSKAITNASHRTQHLIFRNCFCNSAHLEIDIVYSILRRRNKINTLVLGHKCQRIISARCDTVQSHFIDG